jgi:HPt (histidine-containing phosphotransfer) domain-containing protein
VRPVSSDKPSAEKMGRHLGREPLPAIDLAFLSTQTLSDRSLERDVLGLYIVQVREIVARLRNEPTQDHVQAAHLLSGSSRGIGAWTAAAAAAKLEASGPDERAACLQPLLDACDAACIAAEARLRELARE